jgi:hypothetical protein
METNRRRDAKAQAIEIPTISSAIWWLAAGLILVAMLASANAQPADQQQLAYNATATMKSDYAKPLARSQSPVDFSDTDLVDQQMIALFKSEHSKLSEEISVLIAKTDPGKQSSIAADETDMMQVAILKNKLEYLEIIMKKWITDGDF